jgi:hypothetical protein
MLTGYNTFIKNIYNFTSALAFWGETWIPLGGKEKRIKVEGNAIYYYDDAQEIWTIHTKLTEIVRNFNDLVK